MGQLVHERDQRIRAAVWHALTEDPADWTSKAASQQRQRAVANMLILVANRGVARIDARGVLSLEHLERLLIDADNDGVLRGP